MPRVTYVKHARQRYETVPDIDPETGLQREITTSRTDKRGRPVVQRMTVPDLTRPLPPEDCDFCHEGIAVGESYKWIAPKSGPYGGRRLARHANHPNWQVWEYSQSLAARLAEIAFSFGHAIESAETGDDVQDALNDAADQIEEIAGEKRESAGAMEDGFGHETQPIANLRDIADQLESWADEIRNANVPEVPEPEEQDCDSCDGTGKMVRLYDDSPLEAWQPGSYAEGVVRECGDCGGTGTVVPDAICVMQPMLPAAMISGSVVVMLAILRSRSLPAISGCRML